MNLALFDLDNTLLNGDSDFEWAQFLIEQGVLDREVYDGLVDLHPIGRLGRPERGRGPVLRQEPYRGG